jgi:hypothetical protein
MHALLEDVHDQFSVVAVGQVQQVAAVRLVLACMLRMAMLLRQRAGWTMVVMVLETLPIQ